MVYIREITYTRMIHRQFYIFLVTVEGVLIN